VDADRKLLGSVTDGDIRRGLLQGRQIDGPVTELMNPRPRFVRSDAPPLEASRLMHQADIDQIPMVDEQGRVVDIIFRRDLQRASQSDHLVVIMAGGKGERLRPITETIPKPMIPLGGKPILETIVQRFKSQGFQRFAFCVNYRADVIKDYFGDGGGHGVDISYVEERQRMGTAGALSLLAERPTEPIIVTNGDVLTTMDYRKLLEFHYLHAATGTMCLNIFKYQLPYGAVEVDDHRILRVTEKPVQQFFINAGVYAISPQAFDLLPKGVYFDMTTLFERIDSDHRAAYPLHEYWLDIGQKPDLERAQSEFLRVFGDGDTKDDSE
jgi:NDP-sugar pyrophosphorylase family protein